MKKILCSFALLLLILSIGLVQAIGLDVSSKPVTNAVVAELDEPAVFDITITNLGGGDLFEIYSLVGVDISPSTFSLDSEQTKVLRIEAKLNEALKSRKGFFTFEYRIKGSDGSVQKEQLTINIVDLEDAIELSASDIYPNSDSSVISIENKVNFDFDELQIKLNSIFFSHEESISLLTSESKDIIIPLDKGKLSTVNAGGYLVTAQIASGDSTAKKEFQIRFAEQEDITESRESEGSFVRQETVTKKNIGNVRKSVEMVIERNILSSLFTTFSMLPTSTHVEWLTKYYIWEEELGPGEEITVYATTNWVYLLIVIALAAMLAVLIKKQFETDLLLKKNVSFVRTRGGELALKITLRLKARRFIERIRVLDKLPQLVNLYERYGAIAPDNIDMKNKRLEWNVEALSKDEERIFTYIIYSKIGIVGRFELPSARATYEKEGKVREVTSNRSFFINEPKSEH
jgi:hypothetical protein